MRLLESPDLPPPVWSDAPGFPTREEISEMEERLASLGGAIHREAPGRSGWGIGEPDLVRDHRADALSVGARADIGLPIAELEATARIGLGDLHPNVALGARRETVRRALQQRAYHELTTADPSGDALGLGNSLSALFLGRDAGEYYRASGASLTVAPPSAKRRTWELTGYAEYQNDVERETHVALPRLWSDSVFRSNIVAAEAMQFGGLLRLSPWWGTEALRAQFGLDIMLQGETGDYDLARGSVTLRTALPLFSGVRMGVELGAGSSVGDVTPQRLFF